MGQNLSHYWPSWDQSSNITTPFSRRTGSSVAMRATHRLADRMVNPSSLASLRTVMRLFCCNNRTIRTVVVVGLIMHSPQKAEFIFAGLPKTVPIRTQSVHRFACADIHSTAGTKPPADLRPGPSSLAQSTRASPTCPPLQQFAQKKAKRQAHQVAKHREVFRSDKVHHDTSFLRFRSTLAFTFS